MTSTPDIAILGAGPAALALGAACARRGLHTLCIAPDPGRRWHPTYGAWTDELAGLDIDGCVETSWVSPLVSTDANPNRDLGRRYSRLDTPRLQATLQVRGTRAGVRTQAGSAGAVHHDSTGATITLTSGEQVRATMVVDATGQGSFLAREPGRAPAWQAAYGQVVELEGGHPWHPGEMVLMDFRKPLASGAASLAHGDPGLDTDPTFLYAQPLGKDLVFIEETSLIRRPALEFAELSRRYRLRLASLGLRPKRVISEEYCLITMGGPLPVRTQRTVGFGSAAGVVHPATGYQLTRTLHMAPRVADALALGLQSGDLARASREVWDTIWTRDRLRQWEMFGFGADVLCQLDRPMTERFFDAFFSLPEDQWQGFMSATLSANGIARAMARFYLEADPRLKRLLVNSGARKGGVSLLRSVIGA